MKSDLSFVFKNNNSDNSVSLNEEALRFGLHKKISQSPLEKTLMRRYSKYGAIGCTVSWEVFDYQIGCFSITIFDENEKKALPLALNKLPYDCKKFGLFQRDIYVFAQWLRANHPEVDKKILHDEKNRNLYLHGCFESAKQSNSQHQACATMYTKPGIKERQMSALFLEGITWMMENEKNLKHKILALLGKYYKYNGSSDNVIVDYSIHNLIHSKVPAVSLQITLLPLDAKQIDIENLYKVFKHMAEDLGKVKGVVVKSKEKKRSATVNICIQSVPGIYPFDFVGKWEDYCKKKYESGEGCGPKCFIM
jgi:hypothetical protein